MLVCSEKRKRDIKNYLSVILTVPVIHFLMRGLKFKSKHECLPVKDKLNICLKVN